MGSPESPVGPARDGETRKYSLEDELVASQRPGHDIHKDAGIYPAHLVDRARAHEAEELARENVERLARPAHAEHPVGLHQVVRQESPWEIEAKAHARKTAERTAQYLDSGPAILRPLRQIRLWSRNGLPPEKK